MTPTEPDNLRRSLRLMRAFTLEQRAPERFYRTLAADSVAQVSRHLQLRGARVLDVGGGPGWFGQAFEGAGARYCAVETDRSELAQSEHPAVVAHGAALPFPSQTFDLCFSSNVLEHVATPWTFLEELVRTVRRGGFVFFAFTNWLSPWGGHETSPWHLVGGERAALRYERRQGRPPKNRFGTSLFPVHVRQVLRWVGENSEVELVDSRPRYHPSWCRPIVSVPGLREVATWNLATVLQRR